MEKERQKQEAVANRKRSSRIDEKMARRKEEEEKAAETRRQGELLRKIQAEERKRGKVSNPLPHETQEQSPLYIYINYRNETPA